MADQFLQESCRSYHKCHVANCARRNSLVRKTIGIETERRIASERMDREERQLREHLRSMQSLRPCVLAAARDQEKQKANDVSCLTLRAQEECHSQCINPYPVTFGARVGSRPPQRSRSMSSFDKVYRATHQRGVSKEFEDLCINSHTGQLNLCSRHYVKGSKFTPPALTARHGHSHVTGHDCSERPDLWPGDPEAIHSVRRARRNNTLHEKLFRCREY